MKIAVGLSGGVDSSVAAALLKQQGHEVFGVYMKNWSPITGQSLTDCPWEVDQADAEAVCQALDIPFRSVNFEREYREKVVDYLVREYAAGRTPNPDVMCNKEIKFKAFLEAAESLGADAIATGHYVRKENDRLMRGVDPKKDQSYFLYELNDKQLSKAIFPVGEFEKTHVRELAESFGLPTARKKDSQGICFIGHLNLKDFLVGEIGPRPGKVFLLPPSGFGTMFERIDAARVVGEHRGVALHTIGERAGGCINNRLYAKIRTQTTIPSTYVVYKDSDQNAFYVSDEPRDPDLFTSYLRIEQPIATGGNQSESTVDVYRANMPLSVQIRYQQQALPVASVWQVEGSSDIEINLSEPVFAAALGQSAVLYHQDIVVGGGIICATRR